MMTTSGFQHIWMHSTSPQPSRNVRKKGAAPLSGAEEQTARTHNAYALCACLLSLQMRRINKTRPVRCLMGYGKGNLILNARCAAYASVYPQQWKVKQHKRYAHLCHHREEKWLPFLAKNGMFRSLGKR